MLRMKIKLHMKRIILLVIGIIIVVILIITSFKKATLEESKEKFDNYFFRKAYAHSSLPLMRTGDTSVKFDCLRWIIDLEKLREVSPPAHNPGPEWIGF